MNIQSLSVGRLLTLVCGMTLTAASTGCLQTTVGGQTLPSAYFLEDDVQYFPAGPEHKLSNEIRALQRYKLERQALLEGDEPPEPANP